jgi:hypothetical protein
MWPWKSLKFSLNIDKIIKFTEWALAHFFLEQTKKE